MTTVDDVRQAARGLRGVVRRTPLAECGVLSDLVGAPVLLKYENRQRTGSFKLRGAYTRMARLDAADRRRGVVAASAGNHAQGVALAARLLGLTARVHMPAGAPLPKVEATRGHGADVVLEGTGVEQALTAAEAYAAGTGAVLVHPFDHPDVIAGQGSVALELLEECPALAEGGTVLVAVGGGGLAAGLAVALRALAPRVRLVGVQAAGAASLVASLAAGRPVTLGATATMADGIAVARPGRHTLPILAASLAETVTVSEEEISRALLLLLERAKTVVEPAGAVGVAALLGGQLRRPVAAPVVVVLSGGNVDPLLLLRVIEHGMAAAGRYLRLRVRLPDQPGALAALLATLAAGRANVLEVEHLRSGPRTAVGEAEVAVRLETRGGEHARELVVALTAAGHVCTVD